MPELRKVIDIANTMTKNGESILKYKAFFDKIVYK